MLDGIGERDHTGGERIVGPELTRVDHHVTAGDVRDEAGHVLVILEVIAQQLGVGLGQLGRSHRDVAIEELFRI